METWIIILIVVLLFVAIGVGLGLYFILRKTSVTSSPKGGGNNGGSSGGGGSSSPTNPIGGGSKLISGKFSISPSSNPYAYMTFVKPNSRNQPNIVVSADRNIPCSNYSWQNLSSIKATVNMQITSALVNSVTPGSVNSGDPPDEYILLGLNFGSLPPFGCILNLGGQPSDIQNWVYDKTKKTWCDTTGTYCLRYNGLNNAVTASVYDEFNNTNFQWDNVSISSVPSCSSSYSNLVI